MASLLSRSVLVAAVLLTGCLAPVQPASAQVRSAGPATTTAAAAESPTPAPTGLTTWTVEPSDGTAADGRISLRHVLDPGQDAADQVIVTNFGASTASFRIYASDGIVTSDGSFDLLAPGKKPTDGGSWIAVQPISGSTASDAGGIVVQIPGASSVTVPVKIAVPAGATPGDHPAGIVAELVQSGDSAVHVSSRVGVRVHLRVTGDLVARVQPTHVRAHWAPSWNPFALGSVEVDYTLANTGNVRLGAVAVARVTGPFGIAPASASVDRREILPGQQATAHAELSVWPLLLGRGAVTVTPAVVGDDEVAATLRPTTASFLVWTVPWAQLALVLVILGAAWSVLRWRRRSTARTQALIDAAVAAARATEPGSTETDPAAGHDGGVEAAARPRPPDGPGADDPVPEPRGGGAPSGPPGR